jgi:hypothetical protein
MRCSPFFIFPGDFIMHRQSIVISLLVLVGNSSVWAQDATNGSGEVSHAKVQSNRAMATYWRSHIKPEVRQVESRSLTGKRSCTMYVDSPNVGKSTRAAQLRGKDSAQLNRSADQPTIIREALVNKC